MATNAAFLAAVQALDVTGVKQHFSEPPASVNTADLPAAFPLMPEGGLGEKVLSCFANNKVRRIGFVIAIEPVGQGTQAQNYGKLAALMDNLETALDGLENSQGGTLANFIEYDIAAGVVQVSGIDYWGVRADLTARDV